MTIGDRAKGLGRWLFADPLPIWLAIVGPVGAVLLTRVFPVPAEARLKLAGFVMTILGVGLVAKSIYDTQILFERPRYRVRLLNWLKRLPPLLSRARVVRGEASITLPMLTVSARGHVRVNPKESTFDARLEAIEENAKRIDDRISQAERRSDEDLRRVDSLVSAEGVARKKSLDALQARLVDYSAGSLDWEIVGAAWVIVGQAFGTFPL
jgi:hypothetical protein